MTTWGNSREDQLIFHSGGGGDNDDDDDIMTVNRYAKFDTLSPKFM